MNKYVAITGASSGIGYEAAKAFARRGKNIIAIARRTDLLETLKKEIAMEAPAADVVLKATDLSVAGNAIAVYEELRQYDIEVWINNAGFGNYAGVAEQDMEKTCRMLRLNVEALTVLSSLYVRDYINVEDAQLINVSSCGGYTIVPNAVTYCSTKFYVSTFTEGLARELKARGARMKAKVLAPAATKTGFGKVANDAAEYDYDEKFGTYHTACQVAGFLLRLYDSDKTLGTVDRETFEFRLLGPQFPYAGHSRHNQRD